MLPRFVRDILRPARPDVGVSAKKLAQRHCSRRVSAKKLAQHTKNGSKWVFDGALGELLRGNAAGGAARGEYFRGPALAGPRRASLLRRAPGSRALLLAVLTLQCAAKPYGWHGGQPAQTTTYRVNMRIKGPRHPPTGPRNPPIGLTCAGRGPDRHLSGYRASESAHVRRMRSQKQKWGLTARRRPDAPHASSDTTEAGPRRVPPLVACDGRAVSAEKSPYQQHVVSYNTKHRIAPRPLGQRIRKPPHFEGSAGVMRGDGGI